MILLSKEEIEKLIDPNEMMDQIEEAYRLYGENQFFMPPRPVIEHDNKSLIYMPCYTDDVIGTKILTIFPENSKLGLPSIDGVILLNNAVTGLPYSRHHRSRSAGIPSGIICMRSQRYPYRIHLQSQ